MEDAPKPVVLVLRSEWAKVCYNLNKVRDTKGVDLTSFNRVLQQLEASSLMMLEPTSIDQDQMIELPQEVWTVVENALLLMETRYRLAEGSEALATMYHIAEEQDSRLSFSEVGGHNFHSVPNLFPFIHSARSVPNDGELVWVIDEYGSPGMLIYRRGKEQVWIEKSIRWCSPRKLQEIYGQYNITARAISPPK